MDERISREKAHIVMRVINALRHEVQISLFRGTTQEAELLKKAEENQFHLILAPWHKYLAWSKVEAFYGLTRTSGPTFAGYFADQLLPYELGEKADHYRAILLDFANLSTSELVLLIKALLEDGKRSGVKPLLTQNTPIYCESWTSSQGLGYRMDSILGMPEIANTDWIKRASAIRVCLLALWSMIYEEGPGKSELRGGIPSKAPRAFFQMGADPKALVFRLCYAMSNFSPKDALATFWPDEQKTHAAAQLLLKYADFVRLHTIADTNDVELLAVFFPSAPAEKSPDHMRTVWVEPLAAHLVSELPFETSALSASPQHKALPGAQSVNPTIEKAAPQLDPTQAKDRFIFNAAIKIRELKKQISERDEAIKELRTGGVGITPQMGPPDGESLLDALQERVYDSCYQIQQLERQIAEAGPQGLSPGTLDNLKQKLNVLKQREQRWIQMMGGILELIRSGQIKKDAA